MPIEQPDKPGVPRQPPEIQPPGRHDTPEIEPPNRREEPMEEPGRQPEARPPGIHEPPDPNQQPPGQPGIIARADT